MAFYIFSMRCPQKHFFGEMNAAEHEEFCKATWYIHCTDSVYKYRPVCTFSMFTVISGSVKDCKAKFKSYLYGAMAFRWITFPIFHLKCFDIPRSVDMHEQRQIKMYFLSMSSVLKPTLIELSFIQMFFLLQVSPCINQTLQLCLTSLSSSFSCS